MVPQYNEISKDGNTLNVTHTVMLDQRMETESLKEVVEWMH